MKEKGQVFTLDMLFAIVLVASLLSVSGQALRLSSGHARSYLTRYSLEREANDAADILVKSPGTPIHWENEVENLETPGFANVKEDSTKAVPNSVNITKLARLRELTKDENWDPSQDETRAIMKLFGGTDKFEIKIFQSRILAENDLPTEEYEDYLSTEIGGKKLVIEEVENEDSKIQLDDVSLGGGEEKDYENTPPFTVALKSGSVTVRINIGNGKIVVRGKVAFWDFWPEWDEEKSSGAENSLEEAVVKRSLLLRPGRIATEALSLVHKKVDPKVTYYPFENFYIESGEQNAFDWYILVELSDPKNGQPVVKIEVNDNIQDEIVDGNEEEVDYKRKRDGSPFSMRYHGQDNARLTEGSPYPDPGDEPLRVGNNFLSIGVWGRPTESADVYVIAVPRCSPIEAVKAATKTPLSILEVRVWR